MRQYTQLQSTALSSAEFESDEDGASDTGRLTITFASGNAYTYENVPQKVFEDLQSAPSPGQYYHRYIKDSF